MDAETIIGGIIVTVVGGIILNIIKWKTPPNPHITIETKPIPPKPRNAPEAIGSLVVSFLALAAIDEFGPLGGIIGGWIGICIGQYALKTIRDRPHLKGGMYAISGMLLGGFAIIAGFIPAP